MYSKKHAAKQRVRWIHCSVGRAEEDKRYRARLAAIMFENVRKLVGLVGHPDLAGICISCLKGWLVFKSGLLQPLFITFCQERNGFISTFNSHKRDAAMAGFVGLMTNALKGVSN